MLILSTFTTYSLRMTYLLTDGSIGMKSLDEEFATRLAELEVKFCVCIFLNDISPGPL